MTLAYTLRAVRVVIAGTFAAGCLGCPGTVRDPGVTSLPLPPGVSSDPAVIRAAVASLAPLPAKTRTRPADCASGGSGCTVDVRVETFAYSKVDPDRGNYAEYVGRLTNLDNVDIEAKYGLKPYTEAEYVVRIQRVGAGPAEILVLELPPVALVGARVKLVHRKELKICHKRTSGGWSPDLDFAEFKHPPGSGLGAACRTASAPKPGIYFASVFNLGPLISLLAQPNRLSDAAQVAPIWLECDSGCCT